MNHDRICGLVALQLHYETGREVEEITNKIFKGREREYANYFSRNIELAEVPGYYRKPICDYKADNAIELKDIVNAYKDAKLKLEVADKANFDDNF